MTTQPADKRIAFLGLGKMGLPMAGRLVSAGYRVIGFDPVGAAREALQGAGGQIAATPGEAAEGAAYAITMLLDGRAVHSALAGPEGIAGRLAPGAIVIDMSSSAPVGTRDLAGELASRGITLLDAPVSGGVKRAIDGSLAIMVGGVTATPSPPCGRYSMPWASPSSRRDRSAQAML